MLDDEMNDQLGLFGMVTVKKDTPSEVVKRKKGDGDVSAKGGTDVQPGAEQIAADPVEPVNPAGQASAVAAPSPVEEKAAASPKRPTGARGRGKASNVKLPVKAKPVSGLVPAGDVRLTANIREDLHLKLKIAAAHRRTTIGELIEELVDRYL